MIVIKSENNIKVIHDKIFFNKIRMFISVLNEITKGNIINILRRKVKIIIEEENENLNVYIEEI